MTSNGPSSRLWLAGGALLALLIVLASWFLVISPVRGDTSTLEEDTASVETQNTVLLAELNRLEEQDANRDQLVQTLRDSLAGLPADVAIPDFNKQVVSQAAAHNVDLTSVTVGPATAPVQDGAAGAATSTTDPSAPATGLLGVPITIETTGSQIDLLYFLKDLQQAGPRRALVVSTAFADQASTDGASADGEAPVASDDFKLTTQLTIFSSSLSDADREQLADVLGDDLSG